MSKWRIEHFFVQMTFQQNVFAENSYSFKGGEKKEFTGQEFWNRLRQLNLLKYNWSYKLKP